MAAAQPRCVYCGADLPAETVEMAAAARAALEAEWAREPGPLAAGPSAVADTPRAAPTGRRLLVLDLEGAEPTALAAALRLSAFEAEQLRRRGGPELHRILPPEAADAEAARLDGHGVRVVQIPEDDVRAAEPVLMTRGGPATDALALEGEAGEVRVGAGEVLLVVLGAITREYQTSTQVRRVSMAGLEPGYRVHLHRRTDAHPVEIDPAAFDFGPGGAPGGAQREIASWVARLFPDVPRDDSFRRLIPALAPALPAAGGTASAADAFGARVGRTARLVLDNLAQFRFHSAWRAAFHRLRAR